MLIDIPESVDEGSFYRGQVYVGVKNLILEPSSPLRHIVELEKILIDEKADKPILCLYTDGGPDHRLTYLSVQLAIVCLFISGNYDMVVAARTPPMSSWKNPPERIMSILNLALQAVGLMREKATDECERKLNSASGIGRLRELAAEDPNMRQEMIDSFEPVKVCVYICAVLFLECCYINFYIDFQSFLLQSFFIVKMPLLYIDKKYCIIYYCYKFTCI